MSMSDYKTAKEAFVSDNTGQSLLSINLTSLTAWSAYLLYALFIKRFRPSPWIDYLTTVLPLLIAVTISADHPISLNVLLLLLSCLVYPRPRHAPYQNGHAPGSETVAGAGKWLEESDSDEEETRPVYSRRGSLATSSSLSPERQPPLPSQLLNGTVRMDRQWSSSSATSSANSPVTPPPASPLSPDELGLGSASVTGGSSSRSWRRRRHTPTPSTHTHTAIDILPTPEIPNGQEDQATLRSRAKDEYPSARRSGSNDSPNGIRDVPSRRTHRHGDSRDSRRDADTPSHEAAGLAAEAEAGPTGRLAFLSVYRAHMMIMTIHCILAVDFPIFPRVQGKCEDFGTSLMDVGVGSFVFSLGLVSARTTMASTFPPGGPSRSRRPRSTLEQVKQALWKSLPIIALGVVRVLMVKGSEYPEHVTEYGVHWNFFFTLALLPILGISLKPTCTSLGYAQTAILVSLLQHFSLSHLGLRDYVLSPTREGPLGLSLVGLNKEGLISLPGYLSIYLLGIATGRRVMRSNAPGKRIESVTESEEESLIRHYEKRRADLAMELVSYSIGWWGILFVSRLMGSQVSRRMANLGYIFWVAAYNTSFLLGYLLVEIKLFPVPSPPQAVPPLLEAVNRNGLAVFLVANLMTGLVNLSMETMYASNMMAMAVLVGYSAAVSLVSWLLSRRRIKL